MKAPWVIWAGLGMVLTAAAVLSFHALDALARSIGIPPELGWLLPIAIDAGGAVSCSAWLSRRCPDDAARFARLMTWGLLVLTVAGNAAQLGMAAATITPPWWVAVLVGAIPPVIVGSAVHLAVLVGRGQPVLSVPPEAPTDLPQEADEVSQVEMLDEHGTSPSWDTAPLAAVTEPRTSGEPVGADGRVAELIAGGAGRVQLQRELQITEYAAKQLLREHRNGHQAGGQR